MVIKHFVNFQDEKKIAFAKVEKGCYGAQEMDLFFGIRTSENLESLE